MKNEQVSNTLSAKPGSNSLDEIVFEGKNKKYGAYVLRKIYPDHITKALIYASIAFFLVMVSPKLYELIAPEEKADEELTMKEVKLAEPPPIDKAAPPPPPLPPPPPPPRVSSVRFVPPEPVPEEEVPADEEPPPVEELKDKAIANETVEGDPNAEEEIIAPPVEDNGAGKVVDLPKKEEVFTVVEQMPSYPGGDAELGKFLNRNIRYPAQATRNNVEGIVYVQFVVDPEGKVTNATVIKGIGSGCDDEALRVVNKMPNWKPGKQAGRAVSVKYTLPIKFKIQ